MPPIVAASAIAAGGLLAGAEVTSAGGQKGAQIQSDAALQAAKLQKESNDQAQATIRAQQAQDLAIANSTQQANYNQWRSREQRMSDFGSALGLSPRNIPDYQPIAGASGAAPSGQAPSAAGAWTPDFIRQQLQQTGQDPSDQNVQYFLSKENELKAREAQLKQPGYALWRVRDPNSGKSGASMPAPYANSLATMNTPQSQSSLVLTPALQQPNSFAQYMSR